MTIAFHSNAGMSELYAMNNAQNVQTQGWEDIRKFEQIEDKCEFSKNDKPAEATAPEIGLARILFNRLTPEQIATINENKQMPKNAKFVDDPMYGLRMTWNIADISAGTHTLPAGYELKNDILGFTHVVREGTQAWYLKK